MKKKDQLRKKFFDIRKKRYFNVAKDKFNNLVSYIKKKYKTKKKLFIALYYPSNYEINILSIFNNLNSLKTTLLLPKIIEGDLLKFVKWNQKDILIVNKFGIPEPYSARKSYIPDIILVPILAFDKKKNRLGYGKGFYDRYLNSKTKLNKKIEAIGIAFSFQKSEGLPTTKFDFKLNKIFTDKGFIK